MLKNKTALFLAGLTLFIFFVGGVLDWLYNPIIIGILLIMYILIIINLIMVNKETDDEDTIIED